jgi:hypothetical protein
MIPEMDARLASQRKVVGQTMKVQRREPTHMDGLLRQSLESQHYSLPVNRQSSMARIGAMSQSSEPTTCHIFAD